MKYDPEKFSKLASSKLGLELWDFLTHHDNIIRMETASDLGKPAAKALSRHLLYKFGDQVRDDRVKQMIGHMIKQILAYQGYDLEQRNVLVNDGLFKKASRYKLGTD
jgi:hypothetical protein